MYGSYGAAYRRAALRQRFLRGRKRGDEAAVGGAFDEIGAREAALLRECGFESGSLIDIGCGAGRLACALAGAPGVTYLGLDVSPALLESARQRSGRQDWRFERVRGPVIPAPDASADAVTAFSVFTHIPEAESLAYVREARRVLKPGGFLLFSFLDPDVAQHRASLRAPWIEAVVTKLFWAPNVATRAADIARWADATGLRVRNIGGLLGQSYAVLELAQTPNDAGAA